MGLRLSLFGKKVRVWWNEQPVDLGIKALYLGLMTDWDILALPTNEELAELYAHQSTASKAYVRKLHQETAEALCKVMGHSGRIPLETLLSRSDVELETDVAQFRTGAVSSDPNQLHQALLHYDDTLLHQGKALWQEHTDEPAYLVDRINEMRREYDGLFAQGINRLWQDSPELALEVCQVKAPQIERSITLTPRDREYFAQMSEERAKINKMRNKLLRDLRLVRISDRTSLAVSTRNQDFFGRVGLLNKIVTTVQKEQFVTLRGPGGIGKTTVMLEASRRMLPDYTGGIWILDLNPLRKIDLQSDQMAKLLVEWFFGTGLLPIENKAYLLLLDNCENQAKQTKQLVDAVMQEFLDIRIIAATRNIRNDENWGVEIEVAPFKLPSLEDPDSANLMQLDALKLFFYHRGRAGYSDVPASDQEAIWAAEVCIQAAGIPLAIQLLARAPGQNRLNDLVRHIQQFWTFRRNNSDAFNDRQSTMYDCVYYSYALLSEQEQALFRRLSVFVSGFTTKALKAVCVLPGEETEYYVLLSTLVGSNLVLDKKTHTSPYRLLEPIRAVAEKLLEANAEREHIESNYENWIESHASDVTLAGSETQKDADAVVASERRRIEERIDALKSKDALRAAKLELRLVGLIWLEGLIQTALNRLTFIDGIVDRLARDKDKMTYFVAKAILTFVQAEDDYMQTLTYAEGGLRAAIDAGNAKYISFCYSGLGILRAFQGLPEAEEYIETGQKKAEDCNDDWSIALAWMCKGLWHWHNGNSDEAVAAYQEALTRFQTQNHRIMTIFVLNSLAHLTCRDTRDPLNVQRAAKMYLESIALASAPKQILNNRGLAGCILGACGVAHVRQEDELSIQFYAAGRKAYASIGAGMLPPIKKDYASEMQMAAQTITNYDTLHHAGEQLTFAEAIMRTRAYFETVVDAG